MTNALSTSHRRANAEQHVRRFTLAAMAAGAVPVPGASLAVHAIVGAELTAITHAMGAPFDGSFVMMQIGRLGLSAVFTTLFIDGARAMGWFGGPFGVFGVMVLGSGTAGLEAFVVGHLAIALCDNPQLNADEAKDVVRRAKKRFEEQDWH